jgi:hypothetical protein
MYGVRSEYLDGGNIHAGERCKKSELDSLALESWVCLWHSMSLQPDIL